MASTGTTSRRSPTSPARRPPGTPRSTSPPARRSRRTVTNPRSRWMLVFDLARDAWDRVQARIHGHEHTPSAHSTQYGPRTAFGVGMIHGVGAETGSQALLLAGVAGVTGVTGVVILLAFVVGLLISNTLVAVVSASGFMGAQRLRTVYVVVGAVAGLASLLLGVIFISE